MIGKTISHYQILEQLGGGGMGIVYRAEDIKLKRPVALKFLSPQLSFDQEAKRRFIHEAQAASALDHPNICTIYEIDEAEDGQMFIAMAYYEGETLKKKISHLDIFEGIKFAVQIAQGLAQAHKNGIVHRDIKPANVMITNDGLVKILDFGLAKLVGASRVTKAGTTMGTPLYMSPEQIKGSEVDHRSDIWSFGVVLYEMFTGQPPFSGDYEQATLYAIVYHEPRQPSEINPQIPASLERIIRKALQKRAEDRFDSMQTMLGDLKRVERDFSKGLKHTLTDTTSDILNLLDRGKNYLEKNEFGEALSRFRAVLQLNPDNRQARDLITEVERKQKEQQEILNLLSAGKRLLEKGEYQQALQTFHEVLVLKPDQQDARDFISKAQDIIKRLETIDKLFADAAFYTKKKKFEQVVGVYKQILDLDPTNKNALRGLQEAERELQTMAAGRTRTMSLSAETLNKPLKPRPKLGMWIGAAVTIFILIAGAAYLGPRIKTLLDSASQASKETPSVPAKPAPDSLKKAVPKDDSKPDPLAGLKKEVEEARRAMIAAKQQVPGSANDKLKNPRYGQALAVESTANNQFQAGDYEASRNSFKRAMELYQAAGEIPLTGNLTVNSTPPGALIYLNGRATREKTPFTFSGLEIGTYQIRLTLTGYSEGNSAAVVNANQTARAETGLKPLPPGKLAVSAVIWENGSERLAFAELFVDGQALGQIPGTFSLSAGSHRLNAKIFGYVLEGGEKIITIQSEQTTTLKLKFVKP
ncbi:MAG: protein kinase [candidate division KSB1 bacterium]|nr:protein kinase [candidate division KSB1 bacterium]MDZ7364729.1 protein kinase [candidate division KSB1 bacterium]MDZ7402523.1 protein kinase [candidate division KSB1 bacterium]